MKRTIFVSIFLCLISLISQLHADKIDLFKEVVPFRVDLEDNLKKFIENVDVLEADYVQNAFGSVLRIPKESFVEIVALCQEEDIAGIVCFEQFIKSMVDEYVYENIEPTYNFGMLLVQNIDKKIASINTKDIIQTESVRKREVARLLVIKWLIGKKLHVIVQITQGIKKYLHKASIAQMYDELETKYLKPRLKFADEEPAGQLKRVTLFSKEKPTKSIKPDIRY